MIGGQGTFKNEFILSPYFHVANQSLLSVLHENEQMDSAGIACHKLGSKIIPSNATSCGQTKFWVGGDYTPINEYI